MRRSSSNFVRFGNTRASNGSKSGRRPLTQSSSSYGGRATRNLVSAA